MIKQQGPSIPILCLEKNEEKPRSSVIRYDKEKVAAEPLLKRGLTMKIKAGMALIVLLSLMVFSACTDFSDKDKEGRENLVLKSYEVPGRSAKEISETINELLGWKYGNPLKEYPPTGKANLTPDGQLLVNAPESFHRGMKDFLARVQNASPEPSPTVEVDYWIVAGRKTNVPSKLEEFNRIKPALQTIQNNQGNMEFKLLDHVTATSSGQGTKSSLSGALIDIQHTLSLNSDGSLLIWSMIRNHSFSGEKNNPGGFINTQIETRSGELVVLGQTSQEFFGLSIFQPPKEDLIKNAQAREIVNVYYIISAAVK